MVAEPQFHLTVSRLMAQLVKNLPAIQVLSLGREDSLEKGMATHFSILSWNIPWTEKPGRLQSMGSQRIGHNGETNIYIQGHGTVNSYV